MRGSTRVCTFRIEGARRLGVEKRADSGMPAVEVDHDLERAPSELRKVHLLRARQKSVDREVPGVNVRVGDGIDDGILIRKILVERADRQIGPLRDGVHRRSIEPVRSEQGGCRRHDVGNAPLTAILPFAWDKSRTR